MNAQEPEHGPSPIDCRAGEDRRLRAYWMPYTGNRQFKREPRIIRRASGTHFNDDRGRQVFDGASGLWCVPFGHCREEITAAVAGQLAELDYAPSFQFGHEKAFELATRLCDLAPQGLDHAFFCNSGSEAADTAMKMARGYWRLRGMASKTRVIGKVRAYHGVNFGGMSVGGISANRRLFGGLPDVDHLGDTLLPENRFSRGIPSRGAELADELERLVALHDASTIAAIIIEPFAGSGGVIVPPEGYLARLREICDRHEILLIFDEVISGFGRTGSAFGASLFGVRPDIMTVAKALTNGAVPMGAVLAHRDIYDTYMAAGGPDYLLEFPHGYTYSGHPVACAAALAALDIYTDESMVARAAALAPVLEDAVHSLDDAPHVVDVRNIGMAAAVQLEARAGEPGRRPFEVAMHCWEAGFYVRYGGDCVTLAPQFIATDEDIIRAVEQIGAALRTIE